jgi:hypothetical protein
MKKLYLILSLFLVATSYASVSEISVSAKVVSYDKNTVTLKSDQKEFTVPRSLISKATVKKNDVVIVRLTPVQFVELEKSGKVAETKSAKH